MTPQEQQMLKDLTDRINQTQLPEKDNDAEQFLQQTLGRNPDALYILSQTVLVQQYALDQAKSQLTDLKAQLDQARQQAQQPQKHTSFLGNLLGQHDNPAPAPPPRQQAYQQVQYDPVPVQTYAPVQPQFGGYAPPQQGGGFLQSALTTAAGVTAGALAFEGIEDLMHGFGHAAGYGSGFGGGYGMGGFEGQGRPEEVINNNYYGGSGEHDRGSGDFSDRVSQTDHLSNDIEDRRGLAGDSSQNSTNDDTSDDSSNFDDNSSGDDSTDGSSIDDSSDSGSSDDNSF